MNKQIHLRELDCLHYHGIFHYLVIYDIHAGRKDRYTVYVDQNDGPIIIGRELELTFVRETICQFETCAEECNAIMDYFGDRETILKVYKLRYGKDAEPS